MHEQRPQRSMQQVRGLLQTMGRSIDEARQRRLGPVDTDPAEHSAVEVAEEAVLGGDAPSAPAVDASHPPIRSRHEMFTESAPRLKARPKRAS